MAKWVRRFRGPKDRPRTPLRPGIYFRDIHNRIYYLPNTWRAGVVIEFVAQAQGFVCNGFRRSNEILPPQKLQALDGSVVEVPLMDLKEWWEQRFVGESSDDPPLPSPGPQAPGASRVYSFPIAKV